MRKVLVYLTVLLGLVLSVTPANAHGMSQAAGLCQGEITDAKIKAIANLVAANPDSKAALDCHAALSLEDRNRVIVAQIEAEGISLEAVAREAAQIRAYRETPDLSIQAGMYWTQDIERFIPTSAYPYQIASVASHSTSWTICDNDASDLEYIFAFTMYDPMDHPDNLRAYVHDSGSWGGSRVAWMLNYYGVLKGYGWTDSRVVRFCIGDGGLSLAGGINNIYSYLRALRL